MAEPETRPEERPSRQWRWTTGRTIAVTAAIVLGGWGGFLALQSALLPERETRPPGEASRPALEGEREYDPARPVAKVVYADREYRPQGAPGPAPEGEMVQVGLSAEGYVLYAPASVATRAGGGGGRVSQTVEPLYLRAKDGRYVRLAPKAVVEDDLSQP